MLPYSKLPAEAWRKVGVNAGVLLTRFDPETGAANRADILGATAGPVRFVARPVLEDLAAPVRNCPACREMLVLRDWTVRLSGTLVTADTPAVRRLIALADVAGDGHIVPRAGVDPGDFDDLWYAFDYGGGAFAIRMRHALSTGGLCVTARPAALAQWPFEFTALCSAGELDETPFEVWAGLRD